ncbi:hypothetical protein [Actinopolyspora sp. BKK2]|uniref:hypothetical protein n=1 Tax=Actinopolyspora sp. BKK2 TaxID=2599395 RepID=UPI001F60FC38|nr:hypothetical protein [Actinopolyspora sp. BKK2]
MAVAGFGVEAGGDATPLLQAVDAAFDGVVLAITSGIEGGWISAARAVPAAVSGLLSRLWDGGGIPRRRQVLVDGS